MTDRPPSPDSQAPAPGWGASEPKPIGPPVFEPVVAPTPPPPPAFERGASTTTPPTVRVPVVGAGSAEGATGRPPSFGTLPAGPPESLPYPSGQPGPAGDKPKRRFWPAIAVMLGALVLLAGGVGVGFVIADRQGDDQPRDGEAVVDEPVSVQEDETPGASSQPVIPVQPGPVSENEAEPVAAVAAAVAQSVVRIDTAGGTGSGIIYDESGLVVTNAHVVQGATSVSVQLADGTRLDGNVVDSDPAVDVAVVQITGSEGIELVPAVFAPTSTVEVGQLAVAIGSPFGLEQSVTAGIISAVSRAIQATNVDDGSPTIVEMVQTDAPINPGNSGGALADRQGRVVGMNTSIRTDGTVQGNLGVGFAIPSDTLLLIAERIVAGESLESGFLGVSGQDPMTGRAGALLTEVVAGGPAEAAGLEVGDLIVAIDGESVAGMTELAAKIRITPPDTEIVVEVVRAGETIELGVILGVLGQS